MRCTASGCRCKAALAKGPSGSNLTLGTRHGSSRAPLLLEQLGHIASVVAARYYCSDWGNIGHDANNAKPTRPRAGLQRRGVLFNPRITSTVSPTSSRLLPHPPPPIFSLPLPFH